MVLLVVAVALSACGGKKEAGATQVAAKVNKEEISIHQVNYLLQRQAGLKPEQLDAVSRQTLDALIDQELALQAASEQHIDRDPSVMLAVEAARRDIVARAYAERLAEGATPPTADEVKQYYDSKPGLFAQRRLYTLVESALEATPAQLETLQNALPATKSGSDVAALLRTQGLHFGTRQVTLGAEALPMQAVDALAVLREGQSHLITGPAGGRVLTVVSALSAPLSLEEARTSIEKYLLADHKRQLVERQIKALRSTAHIEYQGKFAQLADTSAAASPDAASSQARPPPPTPLALALDKAAPSLK